MRERKAEEIVSRKALEGNATVFLCSEEDPERCHRRLVLEYLMDRWEETDYRIVHL